MVSLAKRANEAHDLLVWMEELPSVFNYVLTVMTQGKALATSALYLKRTSHNWDSL